VMKRGVPDVSMRVDRGVLASSSAGTSETSSAEGEVEKGGLLVVRVSSPSSSTGMVVSVAVVVVVVAVVAMMVMVLLHVFTLKLRLDPLAVRGVSDHGEDGSDAFDELDREDTNKACVQQVIHWRKG
jgi:hypothetical protein